MPVLAKLVDGLVVAEETATGPGSDTTIAANSSGTVALAVLSPSVEILYALGVKDVKLPDGLALEGITAKDDGTVELKVRNVTGSDIAVGAGSISAKVVVVGY